MKRLTSLVALGAALAALCAPAVTLAAGGTPTLSQNSDSGFPDKSFTLTLPQKRALSASQVTVTENGTPVEGLAVEPPGGSATGAILLIDGSKSMAGQPIASAMAAGRAFMAQRKPDMPVSVVVFGPNQNVITDFSTDAHTLATAVAKAPPLSQGTNIYDALVKASQLAKAKGLQRTTVVLLSDGADTGSSASLADAEKAMTDAHVRVISVGLKSGAYDPQTLKTVAARTGGGYLESVTPAQLVPIFQEIGAKLANEYVVTYRSLLAPKVDAVVAAAVAGLPTAKATYTTPAIDFTPRGSFDHGFVTDVILSPWLLVFVIVAVVALLAFAALAFLEIRKRSLPRRMAQYVAVPSEDESRARRAEVTAMLAERAEQSVGQHRWWQAFERDVELGDWKQSPLTLAGWTIVAGIGSSLVAAIVLQSLLGLFVGLAAPFVMRYLVTRKVRKKRAAFAEMLPENVDVIAGSLRAGHSLIGAMNVMVEDAYEPAKTEFRRVLQDEQLGVPIDEAMLVMADRMQNPDVEQLAIVTRLQREAGGNTAEVLDRCVETMRGRMELRRLVNVLTAQNRFARWILTALPLGLLIMIETTTPTYLDPLLHTVFGKIMLVAWVVMLGLGSYWIKKITTLEV